MTTRVFLPTDTIFALSSGSPPAAIAIVRVSGPAAAHAVLTLAGRLPPPRYATVQTLHAADGEPLDRALVLWFPGPGSATGEDLAELHLHGGRAVVAAVLTALDSVAGLRSAMPGEFTRRAFLNARIDLAQAEGLADLLQAETETQRRQAFRLAEGGLSRLIVSWREALLNIAAEIEAKIEYSEDAGDEVSGAITAPAALDVVIGHIAETLRKPPAEKLRDGIRVVFAGPVNAGKSSLFNALLGREAAIASEVAGTTRDIIEAPIVLDGVPLILIDTAGLRSSIDPIERIGVERAGKAAAEADILLWLGSPADRPLHACSILVHSRADERGDDLPSDAVATSVISQLGLAELRKRIIQEARDLLPISDAVSLNLRHRIIIEELLFDLTQARNIDDLILQAEFLRTANRRLDEVVGGAGIEDMLDRLFGRFCIGK